MVNLGDYLGQLLSEITIARVQADLEAIRIAELYANHELLKHFPIPRVRLKDIDLDIPFVVIQTEDLPDIGSPRGGLILEDMRRRFTVVLQQQSKFYSIEIDDQEEEDLDRFLDDITRQMVRPGLVQVDTNLVADRFTSAVRKILGRRRLEIGPDKFDSFVKSVRAAARTDFIDARSAVPRVVVGVTSAEIREAPSESIVRISLRIVEEGMEWTYISPDDKDADGESRLVPE